MLGKANEREGHLGVKRREYAQNPHAIIMPIRANHRGN